MPGTFSEAFLRDFFHLTPQDQTETLQRTVAEVRNLRKTLKVYASCRHGGVDCQCTNEAREALGL